MPPVPPLAAPPAADPFLPPDDAARAAIRALLAEARHGVLGCLDPASGAPHLSRVALQADADGVPLALLSGLALHTQALRADPRCGLLLAPEGGKGDPMSRPRLSLEARAAPAAPDPARRERWLAQAPKARLYIDLPDFRFWRLVPVGGLWNAGFGRAMRLGPAELPPWD